MTTEPFRDITCAYELHYHYCFQTKFGHPVFSLPEHRKALVETLRSICRRNDYHLLEQNPDVDMFYCLLSLRPEHTVSEVARVTKTNLSREFNLRFAELADTFKERALWSGGYFVRTAGKASRKAAESYIYNQAEHHGSVKKELIEIMRWLNPRPEKLSAAHCTFDLAYHVVLGTVGRRDVFDSYIAPVLFETLANRAQQEGFYIERMSILPDHMHVLLKTTPSHCIKSCVLALMNRSCQFMMERYSGVLKNTEAFNLWEESCYLGSVGHATTAQIKSFLRDGKHRDGRSEMR